MCIADEVGREDTWSSASRMEGLGMSSGARHGETCAAGIVHEREPALAITTNTQGRRTAPSRPGGSHSGGENNENKRSDSHIGWSVITTSPSIYRPGRIQPSELYASSKNGRTVTVSTPQRRDDSRPRLKQLFGTTIKSNRHRGKSISSSLGRNALP